MWPSPKHSSSHDGHRSREFRTHARRARRSRQDRLTPRSRSTAPDRPDKRLAPQEGGTRELLGKVWKKLRYGTVLYYLSTKLYPLGIRIEPYWLELESLQDQYDPAISLRPGLHDLTAEFLDEADIEIVRSNPEHDIDTGDFRLADRLKPSCLCFGVKHKGEIAAITWCHLEELRIYALRYALQENEAYLFDAYTYKKYRGMNLMPYTRYELYKRLTAKGRTRYYSATLAFNTPSLRFKAKLGARHLRLYLWIALLNRFERMYRIWTSA